MSWTFCRCLKEAGLGDPQEWFGSSSYVAKKDTWAHGLNRNGSSEFAQAWVNAAARETSVNGIFASKLMFSDFLNVLANPFGRDLMENSVLVWLERTDPRAQVTSLAAAIDSGQWFSGSKQTTQTDANTTIDALLTRSLHEATFDTAGWRSYFAMTGLAPIILRDTDLQRDMAGALAIVAKALDVTIDADLAAEAGGAHDGSYKNNLGSKTRLDAACTDLFSDIAYRKSTYRQPIDGSPRPAFKEMRRKLRHSLRHILEMQTTPRKGRR